MNDKQVSVQIFEKCTHVFICPLALEEHVFVTTQYDTHIILVYHFEL
jgi:hypothetical protein